jgi:hypothetical protein
VNLTAMMGLVVEKGQQNVIHPRLFHAVADNPAVAHRPLELFFTQAVDQLGQALVLAAPGNPQRRKVFVKDLV